MAARRYFIHVGLPKTGSTWLQTEVFTRMPGLMLVSRPYTQEAHGFNLLQYADDTLYSRDLFLREFEQVERQCGSRSILISDEELCGQSSYNFINRSLIANRVADLFPGAEIIVFLRGQRDLLRSLYNQYIKVAWFHGRLDAEFISVPGPGRPWRDHDVNRDWRMTNRYINVRSLMNRDHFLYTGLLDLYSRLFGKVHVFLYEDLRSSRHEVLERLQGVLDSRLPESPLGEPSRTVNERLPPRSLVRQMLHNRLAQLTHQARGQVGARVSALLSRFVDPERFSKAHESYVDALMSDPRVAESNRELERKYQVGLSRHPDAYPQ